MYNFIVFCLIFLSFSPIAGESSIFDWFKTEKVEHISEFIINNRDNTNLVNQYNGLQDLEVLDKLLKDENYKEALKHVWTEPDLEKKIAWLEMKSFENHVVMQYELAVAYRELDQSELVLI